MAACRVNALQSTTSRPARLPARTHARTPNSNEEKKTKLLPSRPIFMHTSGATLAWYLGDRRRLSLWNRWVGGREGREGGGEGEREEGAGGGGRYSLAVDLILDRTRSLSQSMRIRPRVSEGHDVGRWKGVRVLGGAPVSPLPPAVATTAALVQGVEETLAGCSEGAWVLAGPSGTYPIIVVRDGGGVPSSAN